jgi:hypothetical protein
VNSGGRVVCGEASYVDEDLALRGHIEALDARIPRDVLTFGR